jgi:ABC-2 type transport system ATP-binding protein
VATVLVRSPEAGRLADALSSIGASVTRGEGDSLLVTKVDPARIGDAAHAAGIALHELSPQQASLEEVFMELTSDSVDFHGHARVGVAS